jgi:hypothetical protein
VANPVASVVDFYRYVSAMVVEALLVQRADLQLFAPALWKAFDSLPALGKMKRLPRPLPFQDYLSRFMKELDCLLGRLHAYDNGPRLVEAFLTNVAVLPDVVATIFEFKSTFFVVDHVDCSDVDLESPGKSPGAWIALIEYGQCLLAPENGDAVLQQLETNRAETLDIARGLTLIPVYDLVESCFPIPVIAITFADGRCCQLTEKYAGGCPSFVEQFDGICASLSRKQESEMWPRQKRESKVEMLRKLEQLVSDVVEFEERMSFGILHS